MIVCLCEGINDQTLRSTIRAGANTVRQVRKACGAGGTCGSCVCDIRAMLAERRDSDAEDPATDLLSK